MCLSLVRHCTGAPYDKRASSRVLLGLPFGSEGAGGQACGAGVRGRGDPDTKQPFLKKILQVSGSASASTLIVEFVVTIGSHCLAVGSRYISGDHGRPLISGGHQRPLN